MSRGSSRKDEINRKSDIKYWWLSPVTLILFLIILILIAYTRDSQYYYLYRVGKYIDLKYFVVVIITFALFIFGYLIATVGDYKRNIEGRKINLDTLKSFSLVLLCLTILGYVIWGISFISIYGFGTPFASLSVYHYNSGSIDGITTCTQFGVILCPCLILLCYKDKINRNRYLFELFLLFVLAFIRSYIFSERLAIIELIVTTAITYILVFPQKKWIVFLPVIGIGLLFIVFGTYEYFRSWSYYCSIYNSFTDFIVDRITAYYNLAINTNAMYLANCDGCMFPFFTFDFIRKLPLLNLIPWSSQNQILNIFGSYANAEYNNPGGLANLYLDFGYAFIPIAFIFGYIVGKNYIRAKTGNEYNIIIYSVIFLSLVELPRYFYLGNTRAFYPILALILIKYMINRNIIIRF